nr:hypothetical protein [Sicyoidochytrium minutum DNA virus]
MALAESTATSELNEAIHDRTNNRTKVYEESWHESLHMLAAQYRDDALDASIAHDKAAYSARFKHRLFGYIGPIINIVTTGLAAIVEEEEVMYVVIPLSAVAAAFTFLHIQMDMAAKARQYWEYNARYGELAAVIDETLAHDVDFRPAADKTIAVWCTQKNHLDGNAPPLPGKGWCGRHGRPSSFRKIPTEEELRAREYYRKRIREEFLAANVPVTHTHRWRETEEMATP